MPAQNGPNNNHHCTVNKGEGMNSSLELVVKLKCCGEILHLLPPQRQRLSITCENSDAGKKRKLASYSLDTRRSASVFASHLCVILFGKRESESRWRSQDSVRPLRER